MGAIGGAVWVAGHYLLAFVLLWAGINKITPELSEDFHRELRRQVEVYHELLWNFLPLTAAQLLQAIGLAEVVAGFLLCVPPGRVLGRLMATGVLCGAVVSHWFNMDDRWPPALILLIIAMLLSIFDSKPVSKNKAA